MHLRRIGLKDLSFIKLWMADKTISALYQQWTRDSSDDGIVNLIKSSIADTSELHLIIASHDDECMGIVSLFNIENGSAELAIYVKPKARHKGYAWFGMEEITKKAFNELGLESVYWCVSRENSRAVRFYDKHNYNEIHDVPQIVLKRHSGTKNLKWYSIFKDDELSLPERVCGCKVIQIKTIPTADAGELSFFEGTKEIPFSIKRIYYISKVPEGVRRGFHAHKELKQLLFCPYGRIQLVLENRRGREEIELSDPSIGVIIEECTWREMLWLQKDSVLCVAASDFYDIGDYIRNYDEFKKHIASTTT